VHQLERHQSLVVVGAYHEVVVGGLPAEERVRRERSRDVDTLGGQSAQHPTQHVVFLTERPLLAAVWIKRQQRHLRRGQKATHLAPQQAQPRGHALFGQLARHLAHGQVRG